MPSCVVKWCKNNSCATKKGDGITFHNIPKKLNRRDIWIAAIRRSRGDENWQPSNHTLICSSHFDDTAFYITPQGLRRITREAIPNEALLEDLSKIGKNKTNKPGTSKSFQQIQMPSNMEYNNTQNMTNESDHCSINIMEIKTEIIEPTTTQENVEEAKPLFGKPHIPSQGVENTEHVQYPTLNIKKEIFIELEPSAAPEQACSNSQFDAVNVKSEITSDPDISNDSESEHLQVMQPSSMDCSNICNISGVTSQVNEPEKSHIEISVPSSFDMDNDPDHERLVSLTKKQQDQLVECRKKIKVLNQKVRRLTNRNGRLKKKLKVLSIPQNYEEIDLSTDNVAEDLFNALNRKKHKKEIKYTPSLKRFCLTLIDNSPKIYEYIRSTFHMCLPHPRTLAKWADNIKIGITNDLDSEDSDMNLDDSDLKPDDSDIEPDDADEMSS